MSDLRRVTAAEINCEAGGIFKKLQSVPEVGERLKTLQQKKISK